MVRQGVFLRGDPSERRGRRFDMTRTCLTVTLLAALAVLAGCAQPKGSAKADPAPAEAMAPAAAVDPDANLPPNQRLALAKPGGKTGADKAVESAQTVVRQSFAKDDAWIVLGRAWVRKARESADPGFYLNA